MTPSDCPKFGECVAPICPLDPDWRLRVHIPDEPSCRWLLESVKSGAAARFRDRRCEDILLACHELLSELEARRSADGTLPHGWAAVLRAVERARRSGSRLDAFNKARGAA